MIKHVTIIYYNITNNVCVCMYVCIYICIYTQYDK